MEAYEQVPYPSSPRPSTQPSRLLALGRLHGIPTADPNACRVLEVGCSDGGNLIAAACAHPGSEFLGIDLAPGHVARAREHAEALGLQNVRFEVADITTYAPEGAFDCLIAHGVYSWVPEPVRERLLALYQGALAPDGVATLSLNVYPGWHRRSRTREVLRWAARRRGGSPPEQVDAGLQTLAFLNDQAGDNALRATINASALADLKGATLHYLVHEYLAPVCDPLRYEELAAQVEAHRLSLLCEAYLEDGVVETHVPPAARERFDALAGDDPVARQQLLDLVLDRSFRRPVLVHAGRAGPLDPAALRGVWFVHPQGQGPKLSGPAAGLIVAAESARPEVLDYETASAACGLSGEALDALLLELLRLGALEALAHVPQTTPEPGERPRAFPFARLCATWMGPVFNALSEQVELDPLSLALLTRIDGRRDRATLLDQLVELVASGAIGLAGPDGQPLPEASLRELLGQNLEGVLHNLAQAGVLISATDAAPSVD